MTLKYQIWLKRGRRLSLEGEAGANLVGGLVQVLGIERGTQTEGDTRAEENVVSQSGNTTVVDLGLLRRREI
jgi:hypothetical protein